MHRLYLSENGMSSLFPQIIHDDLYQSVLPKTQCKTTFKYPDCIEIGCIKAVRCKGRCSYHYSIFMDEETQKNKCSYKNKKGEKTCLKLQIRRNLCSKHYRLWKKNHICEIVGCKGMIYDNNLCSSHFKEKRAKCANGDCTLTVFCLKNSLCRFHYHKNRKSALLKESDLSYTYREKVLEEVTSSKKLHQVNLKRRKVEPPDLFD